MVTFRYFLLEHAYSTGSFAFGTNKLDPEKSDLS